MSPRSNIQFEEIRQEKRTLILETALKLFAREGFQHVSVSRLAAEAGISKGLMYNYFASKEEVLQTLMEGVLTQVLEVLHFREDEILTPERLTEIISLSVDLARQDTERWKLFISLTFQPKVTDMMMQDLMPKITPYLTALHRYFADKGHDDPTATMRTLSAMLDGIQMHVVLDPDNFPVAFAKQLLIKQFV